MRRHRFDSENLRKASTHTNIPYSASDIRGALDGSLAEDMPPHVAVVTTDVSGSLKVFGIRTTGGYLRLDAEDRDMLQPLVPPKDGGPSTDQLPIGLEAVGTFRKRDGSVEERKISMHYERWGYRLRCGHPGE